MFKSLFTIGEFPSKRDAKMSHLTPLMVISIILTVAEGRIRNACPETVTLNRRRILCWSVGMYWFDILAQVPWKTVLQTRVERP
jgi:hypothetical protein